MKNLIISFKTRNSLYAFSKTLRANGISVSIINTPRNIAISCGLSIKTDMRHFSIISTMIRQSNLTDFIGMFSEARNGNSTQFERLY